MDRGMEDESDLISSFSSGKHPSWTMSRGLATTVPSRSDTYPPSSMISNVFHPTYFDPIDSTWKASDMTNKTDMHPPPSPNTMMTATSSTTTTMATTEYPNNAAVVAILIALICILCLILVSVTLPPIMYIIRRKLPISKARIDRRYATIDGWLIRKRVQPHDSACECIQRRYSTKQRQQMAAIISSPTTNESGATGRSVDATSSFAVIDDQQQQQEQQHHDHHPPLVPTIALTAAVLLEKLAPSGNEDPDDTEPLPDTLSSSSLDDIESCHPRHRNAHRHTTAGDVDNDDNHSTGSSSTTSTRSIDRPGCSICLEAFRVGDGVSWSTDPSCGHVFHHSCIREWLLRRIACPCCRKVLLPVDRPLVTTTATTSHDPSLPLGVTLHSATTGPTSTDDAMSPARSPHMTGMFYFSPRDANSSRRSRTNNSIAATRTKPRLTQAMLRIFAEERSRRTTTSYYCIQDGLITLDGFGLVNERTTSLSLPGSTKGRLLGLTRGSSSSHRKSAETKDMDHGPTSMTSPEVGGSGRCRCGGVGPATSASVGSDPPFSPSWLLESRWSRLLRRSDTEFSGATTSGTSVTDNGTRNPPSPDQTFDMQEEEEEEDDNNSNPIDNEEDLPIRWQDHVVDPENETTVSPRADADDEESSVRSAVPSHPPSNQSCSSASNGSRTTNGRDDNLDGGVRGLDSPDLVVQELTSILTMNL